MDEFLFLYNIYKWVKECERYTTAAECADYVLAIKALNVFRSGVKVSPREFMRKVKYLPFTITDDELKEEYDKIEHTDVREKLWSYILLYKPKPDRIRLFLEGYNDLSNKSKIRRLVGLSLISKSAINITDAKIEKAAADLTHDLGFE